MQTQYLLLFAFSILLSIFLFPEQWLLALVRLKRILLRRRAKQGAREEFTDIVGWYKTHKHELPKEKQKILDTVLKKDKVHFLEHLTEQYEDELQKDDTTSQFFR